MNELFSLKFFQNALLISLILSVLFGSISFFVVLRKMAFLGAGIAHTAFGGVALGVLMSTDPFATSLVFCALASLMIYKMSRVSALSIDTSIGILFSLSMALGAIFISLKKDYTFDLMGYLFGNVLAVTDTDIYIALFVTAIFMPFFLISLRRLLFVSFDPEVAKISGLYADFLDMLLLVFLSVIIVVSIKIVGIILVSALIILPASFALLLSNRYKTVIVYSVLFTLLTTISGLFLSDLLDTPTGATMVSIGTVIYFSAIGFRALLKIG